MIILIAGSTGAGKTTDSRKLAKELPGIVCSIDNWMKSLFGQDMPYEPTSDWFQENHQWYVDRIHRCEKQIKDLSLSRAQIGQSSILDLGFSTVQLRNHFIRFFNDLAIKTSIHYLDVPPDVRWKRVEQRNTDKGSTYVMNVNRLYGKHF